jgi:hypothetical protein
MADVLLSRSPETIEEHATARSLLVKTALEDLTPDQRQLFARILKAAVTVSCAGPKRSPAKEVKNPSEIVVRINQPFRLSIDDVAAAKILSKKNLIMWYIDGDERCAVPACKVDVHNFILKPFAYKEGKKQ